MYVLLFWLKSKNTSIVSIEDLSPPKNEGDITYAYYNKKRYEAKIVRKSYDKNYLEKIRVDCEGNVIIKSKSATGKISNSRPKNIKIKNKLEKQSKQEIALNEAKKLLSQRTIFESSEEDEDDSENNSQRVRHEQKRRNQGGEHGGVEKNREREREEELQREREQELQRERERELHRERERARQEELQREREREQELQREREREREEKMQQEREREREERRNRERERARQEELQREREREREEEMQQEREREREQELQREREREREERRNREREREGLREREDHLEDDENPLELCRKGGNGRVMLCDVWNVWIDKAELTYLQRFRKIPKEMTRRLLKILVGTENLKNMCARGRSRNRNRIPEDIMSAIEYYVNEKCSQILSPAEFTCVANMMICSMRNPRR